MKEVEFFKKKLDNGLTVIFEPRSLPVVAVASSIRYGTGFESEKIKGTAHFLEHMMFKGTKTRSQEEIAREIEKKGGILNAFTGDEITSYWNKLPSKFLSSGIEISSDLILNPRFDSQEFEREKGVILEEIKMYHDNPVYYVLEKIKSLLYAKPFGTSAVDGTEENVKNITLEEMKSIFKKSYATDSMSLAVVGKANFDEICTLALKLFPKTTRKISFPKIQETNSEKEEKREGINQAHLCLGFHATPLSSQERYAYEVMGSYLFGGMSSKLFQEIREKRALAYAVKGDFDMGKEYGYGYIYVGTMPEKIKQVKEIILKEVKNLGQLEKKELDECKEQLLGARLVAEEDSVNALNLLIAEENAGNAENHYKYQENLSKINLEDVRKLGKLAAYSTFSLLPK